MTRTTNKGKSPHRPNRQKPDIKTKGQMESGRNAGRSHTGPLRYWKGGTYLSSVQVENMLDDRVSTAHLLPSATDEEKAEWFELEAAIWPQTQGHSSMTLSIMEIAQPAKGKDIARIHDIASSSTHPKQVYDAITFPEEDFEIWEDDIYEWSMWDDGWEEICYEDYVHTRPSYAAVLQGKDG